MKAIILAAGKGTRLEPITLEIPKAMVEVFGKPLLAHNMDKLLPYVDEFIIVVKYKKEKIIEYFGESYRGIPVSYHEQGEESGTGAAIKGIELSGEIVIAYADAIFSGKDIAAVMQEEKYAVLVKKVENPEKYGIFQINQQGFATQVIEKPQEYVGNLANFSFFKVNDSILKYVEEIDLSTRGEIELTDAINIFIQNHTLKPVILEHEFLDITSKEDLDTANTLTKPELGTTRYLENIGSYEVHLGIPKNGIQEIINYTLDESDTALREGTGDYKNGMGRFTSLDKIQSWYHDTDRYTFTLLDDTGKVVGIWWGRPAKSPDLSEVINKEAFKILTHNKDNIHTSGIRIYPDARGKGLASPFLELCSRCYNCIFPNYCMSVDIDVDNIPSQKSSEKIGFIKVGYGQNKNNSRNSSNTIGKKRYVYIKKFNS